MKLGLVINNYDSDSGWNQELKYHYKYFLKKKIDCHVLHFGYSEKKSIIKLPNGYNISNIIKIYRILKKNNFDIVHIRGFIGIDFLYIYIALIFFNKTKLVISTVSQVNEINFSKKLFFENPDIKSKSKSVKTSFLKNLSPFFKLFFFKTIGKIILLRANALFFYSKYELDEYKKFHKSNSIKLKIIPDFYFSDIIKKRVISSVSKNNILQSKFNFNINILYWGRIDTGIKGVKIFTEISKNLKKDLVIHLMGPDYNNSVINLREYIVKNDINNIIIHEDIYWRDNLNPLINADASIIPSEWDGFPRTLRESIFLGVPIVCSIPSNFNDIVSRFNCGFTYKNKIELIKILNNLNKSTKIKLKKNLKKASEYLSEERCINRYIKNYYSILNE